MHDADCEDDVILKRHGHYVKDVWDCFRSGANLKYFPGLLHKVLEEESWRDRIVPQTHKRQTFATFREFVETKAPSGLEVSMDVIGRLCIEHERLDVLLAIKKLDMERGGNNNPEGRNQHRREVNNSGGAIDLKEESRSISDKATPSVLLRLEQHRPDLLARVMNKEMSPHAAAIEAGFRKTEYRLPKNPEAAGRYLRERVDDEWMEAMLRAYEKGDDNG